jgi:uncharacterized membrane protein YjgN (DUF898 family)
MNKQVSAFSFHGNWRDFFKIALPNLLLTIVTLSIYRFWATTRERKYLWSQTQFIDERLEWAGTGKELLIGFLFAILIVGIPLFIIQFGFQALAFRGYAGAAGALLLASYAIIFYVFGVAKFRALRYRLSRSYWRGIRGGSNDQGLRYGGSYIWKSVLGYIALGLLIPWSMVALWNERWNKMSFGPYDFQSTAKSEGLLPRFLLFYVSPVIMIVAAMVGAGMMGGVLLAFGGVGRGPDAQPPMFFIALVAVFVLAIYMVIPAIWLIFYAKFYRTVVDGLQLHDLEFGFVAKTVDWLKLYIGDALIWLAAASIVMLIGGSTVASLGIFHNLTIPKPGEVNPAFQAAIFAGIFMTVIIPFSLVGPFIRYRHWKFMVGHLRAFGEVNVDYLVQSETRIDSHGEGLLDAFDVGAI